MDRVGESDSLWLEREPTAAEVKAAFADWDMSQFGELVFCGFGEPTMALDCLLETARFVKDSYDIPIRLNTNGLGNLIWGRDISGELAGLVDTVSISLNHPDPKRYQELVRSAYGDAAFAGMLDFAEKCVKVLPRVVMTTVATTITEEEEARCREICRRIGAEYRIRPFES